MAKEKIVSVPISELKTNLFVRTSLDQNHALYLAELIEGGVKLPAIKITPNREVIDGRHRIEAHELNNLRDIDAVIDEVSDESEIISKGYQANLGGSKPPTPQDTEHTVSLLLERGETHKSIGALLALPPSMARKYIAMVQSKLNRAKMMRALAAVSEGGLTAPKAAEAHGVDLQKLKEAISGHRKRKNVDGVPEIQRALTKRYKSVSQMNAASVRRLLEKYEDGDITEKQVREILSHLKELQDQSARALTGWIGRFDGLTRKKVVKTA